MSDRTTECALCYHEAIWHTQTAGGIRCDFIDYKRDRKMCKCEQFLPPEPSPSDDEY